MFCDWVGYTALSQHLVRQGKHEELVGLRQTFVNTCTDAVARFGGSVVQVSGDGVMIYFGLPAAGDDAERGIRGALATLDALKAVRAAEPINVRIGIATGPVVVGVPSGPGGVDEGLAVGETPNLAQRFQSVAGVNEIVIAHETRRLVGDTFELTDLGELPLKNIDGVRQAWRVDGVRRDDGRFRAAHGRAPLPPLVGSQAQGRPGAAPARLGAGPRRFRTRGVHPRRRGDRQVAAGRGAARAHRGASRTLSCGTSARRSTSTRRSIR